MNKNKHLLSLLTVILFSLFAIASSESEDEVQNEISDVEPEITVKASVLAAEYQENEVAADLKYKGKVLLVTGTVDDIGKDIAAVDQAVDFERVESLDSQQMTG